jgi:hypothetical protein
VVLETSPDMSATNTKCTGAGVWRERRGLVSVASSDYRRIRRVLQTKHALRRRLKTRFGLRLRFQTSVSHYL